MEAAAEKKERKQLDPDAQSQISYCKALRITQDDINIVTSLLQNRKHRMQATCQEFLKPKRRRPRRSQTGTSLSHQRRRRFRLRTEWHPRLQTKCSGTMQSFALCTLATLSNICSSEKPNVRCSSSTQRVVNTKVPSLAASSRGKGKKVPTRVTCLTCTKTQQSEHPLSLFKH